MTERSVMLQLTIICLETVALKVFMLYPRYLSTGFLKRCTACSCVKILGTMLLCGMFVLITAVLRNVEGGMETQNLPACIITTYYSYQWTTCSNPLYTACRLGVCCSPKHYCCNYVDYQNYYYGGRVGCCRRTEYTVRPGEIASVTLGAIAWAGILCVVGFLTCPRLYDSVNSVFFRRKKPKSSTENIVMK